jgi:regulator of RNase E activity RraA
MIVVNGQPIIVICDDNGIVVGEYERRKNEIQQAEPLGKNEQKVIKQTP